MLTNYKNYLGVNAPVSPTATSSTGIITTTANSGEAHNPYYEIPAISGITTPPQCGLLRDALLWSTATFESTPSGGIRFSRGINSNPVWSLSDLWEIVHSFTDVEFDTGLTVDEVIESLVRTILANLDKLPSEFREDYPF